MDKLSLFFESWDFFCDAALTGAVAGALLGALGVTIVLGRTVFLSAALSQVASAGVALAIWIGLGAPTFFSLGMTLVVLCLSSWALQRSPHPDGILAALCIGGCGSTVLIGTQIVHELQDIQALLVGNAVLVEREDFQILIVLTVMCLGILVYGRRAFDVAAFWPTMGRVRGVPIKGINVVRFLILTIAITYTTRLMGALPVFALSCLPALAARPAPNVRAMFWIALVLGALAGFVGYVAAFVGDFPVGPTQAVVALLFVVISRLGVILYRAVYRISHFVSHPTQEHAP